MLAKKTDILLSILCGLLLFFASPGLDLWFLAILAFACFWHIIERGRLAAWKAAFIIGFIYTSLAIHWIYVPITQFGGAPLLAGVVLVLLTGLVVALLFWAPMGLVAARTGSPMLTALVLAALELIKGKYFFGGIPWLNIAQTQYNNELALQLVSALGEGGLSFVTVLLGFYIYKAVRYKTSSYVSFALAVAVVMFGYGALRLATTEQTVATNTARMVQTGVDQADKWEPSLREALSARLVAQFYEAGAEGDYELLILPETSFNKDPFTTPDIRAALDEVSAHVPVLLSADRVENEDGLRIYNTLYLAEHGEVRAHYDKMRLAPFGEYFPFEKQLYPIRRFFFGDGPLFTPGIEPVVFELGGMRIAPLICFEGIFPELVRERVARGANVVVITSNDSWFGSSIGRDQNLAMNVIRAVEFDRYVLRTTQDGISALIDPTGRRLVTFPEKTFHYEDVDFAIKTGSTMFNKLSYTWYVVLLVCYMVYLMRKRRKASLTESDTST